jgi:glyoxylase-like metal-dependent hydrolase (beta-lactamase superfamily II)
MRNILALWLVVGILWVGVGPADAQQGRGGGRGFARPDPIITKVQDDLYKAQAGTGLAGVTMFLVTSEGIIVVNPLNPENAAWLKGELAVRFPGQPVRYVIYSHYHWDHARGGGMFADTARFVAHENMLTNLSAPLQQAKPPGGSDDADGDNRLSRDEATTGTLGNFDRFDGNGDGFLTQAEIGADIRRPDITFSGDQYTLTLGDTRVKLLHANNRHSNDMIDMYFPDQGVVFAGDYVWVNHLCCRYAYDRRPMTVWIDSIKKLEALDFDTFVGSHYEGGTKADVVRFREFLEDVMAAVQAGIDTGTSIEDMRQTIRLEEYRDFAGYDGGVGAQPGWEDVIQSAYDSLTMYSN